MKILSSPHNHTSRVDGKNSAYEMAQAASVLGFCSLGFSEHGVQAFDFGYALTPETEPLYIADVNALKDKFDMRVWRGIELDVYSTSAPEKYEFVIASAHYILNEHTGEYYYVDACFEKIPELLAQQYNNDGVEMACDYYYNLARFIERVRPDIVAHFDLMRLTRVYDANDPRVIAAQFDALDAMRGVNALLEYNTGGMARGYTNSAYPDEFIIRRFCELGGGVIVSADAHSASQIDFAFDTAPEALKAAGMKSIFTLNSKPAPMFIEREL